MLPAKLAFVDIETTGMRAFYDRIIEIGILRVEESQITRTFHSLIDPQSHLPPEITYMTGITQHDLENSPTFRQIKDDILETLEDCIFVAHNVRFDYGFLKNEFKRQGITFTKKHFCTVRLSRALYPQYRHHNLDSLIERFGFTCENRHRAFDDAKILYSFYTKVLTDFPLEQIAKAINIGLKKPSVPLKLKTDLKNIPEKPGVYIFYGNSEYSKSNSKGTPDTPDTLNNRAIPLYVGKSVNLHDRVLSHFSSDIHSPLEMKISQQIESIEIKETVGELGALFLESYLIKKLLPLYNKKSRIKHELTALIKDTNPGGYNFVKLETINTQKFRINHDDSSLLLLGEGMDDRREESACLTGVDQDEVRSQNVTSSTRPHPNPLLTGEGVDFKSILGFFRSKKQAKNFLAETAKQFNLCEKLLGLESAGWRTNGACFAYRLGRCKGACIGKEKPTVYNLKIITAFAATKIKRWPYPGPVLIEETNGWKSEYFLIDKWCYIGSIKVDNEGNKNENFTNNISFDLDIYKIIKQFLSNPQNQKKIKLFKSDSLKFSGACTT